MRSRNIPLFLSVVLLGTPAASVNGLADEQVVLEPVSRRFADPETRETADFQRHVSPLLGRLGCNGRACHGSFQGQGGFRLSLFGYDFKMDHDSLLDKDSTRVDLKDPEESLILNKPTDEDEHEGGKRYAKGSWQHHLLRSWVLGGAEFESGNVQPLERLEVEPAELRFADQEQTARLRAIAVWPDGTREDVTPLCRFTTNDDQIAKVSENGLVTAGQGGDTHVVVFYDNAVVPVPVLRPVSDLAGDSYPEVPTPTKIDELVVAKLRKLGVVPSELARDEEFLRRVSLDLTGTLPSAREVERFLEDASPDKRRQKIDELLESPAYAAWWTTRLCDITGNNADRLRNVTAIRGRASEDWYQWIHKRVAENRPYDEIVEGIVVSTSRRPGQSYREFAEEMSDIYRQESADAYAELPTMPHYWARQEFTTPEDRAIGFAYSFLGIRIQCAQCHKHPFDQWSKEDFEQFKNFFSVVSRGNAPDRDRETRQQYNAILKDLGLEGQRGNQLRRELPKLLGQGKTVPFPEVHLVAARQGGRGGRGRQAAAPTAKLLGDATVKLAGKDDPRAELMKWLKRRDNPYFARALVNRVWAGYFNVGIVEPPDDLSLANPPSNEPLLDYLADQFVANGYDLKWLHREIANSRTYQLSWRTNDTNHGDTRNFSRSVPRRLPAEVAYDAVRSATLGDDQAEAARHDLDQRAIAKADVGLRNPGRSGMGFALQVFGQSRRESNCDCDRSSDPTLLQAVFLQNDVEVYSLLNKRQSGWLDQVADQLGEKLEVRTPAAGRGNLQVRVRALRQRMAKARADGDQQTVQQVRNQLRNLARRAEQMARDRNDESDEASSDERQEQSTEDRNQLPKEQMTQLVRQAYLRSLSRYPTDSELKTSLEFIDGSSSNVDAVRDLLWALINTKEFIVNH